MHLNHLRLLLTGLAAGDSLGATSEFVPRSSVPELYAGLRDTGWPFHQAGGRMWKRGQPTDDTDMAMCMVHSCLEHGSFDGADVARRFVDWMHTSPPDMGITTRRTLSRIVGGAPWYEGALEDYRKSPDNAANGSLMRNGVVAAMADSLQRTTPFASQCTTASRRTAGRCRCCAAAFRHGCCS